MIKIANNPLEEDAHYNKHISKTAKATEDRKLREFARKKGKSRVSLAEMEEEEFKSTHIHRLKFDLADTSKNTFDNRRVQFEKESREVKPTVMGRVKPRIQIDLTGPNKIYRFKLFPGEDPSESIDHFAKINSFALKRLV